MRRAAILIALIALAPADARADDTVDPRVRIALTAVPEGLTATITQPGLGHLPPLLVVRNATGRVLTILDDTGAPFLRARAGVVEGNVRSAFLGPAISPNAPASPAPAGPQPQWRKLGTGDTLRWYDVRAAYDEHAPADPAKAATLKRFTIPLLLDQERATIDGAVTWKPIRGTIQARFASTEPADPKIAVRLADGPIPAIQLTNTSGRTIQITGRDGAPFARIGPGGITVNVNSATYRDTRSQQADALPAAPDWQPQSGTVLVWLERRAAYDGDPPDDVVAARRPRTIGRWSVPGTIDGAPFAIRGTLRWIPAAASAGTTPSRFPWIPVAAGAAVLAAGVALIARRRA